MMMFHLYCRGRQIATLSEPRVRHEHLTRAMRMTLLLCGWLLIAAGCFVLGVYAHNAFQQQVAQAPAASDYYPVQEHYVFKKKPLPVPEEVTEEETEESRTVETPPEPVAVQQDNDNAELKQRVKAAMAELGAP